MDKPNLRPRQDHFPLGHILAPPWWPTYVDATGSSDTLSLWERVPQ